MTVASAETLVKLTVTLGLYTKLRMRWVEAPVSSMKISNWEGSGTSPWRATILRPTASIYVGVLPTKPSTHRMTQFLKVCEQPYIASLPFEDDVSAMMMWLSAR